MYLTLPDVRVLATSNPTMTAFMQLRAAQAEAEGRKVRRAYQWVPYRRISPHLKRAVLVAEDSAFWDHEGIDIEQIKVSIETAIEKGDTPRGASTITQQLAKNLYLSPSRESAAQGEGADHHPPARGGAAEGAHSRALPQCGGVGRRDLGCRGGRPTVLRRVGVVVDAAPRRRYWRAR